MNCITRERPVGVDGAIEVQCWRYIHLFSSSRAELSLTFDILLADIRLFALTTLQHHSVPHRMPVANLPMSECRRAPQ